MPWKIRSIELTGEHPVVQLFDPKNSIYLDVEMSEPKEVHIYIGDEKPENSRLYLVCSADQITVERAERVRNLDTLIMDSILETMGIDDHARDDALRGLPRSGRTRRSRHRSHPRPVVAAPEIVQRPHV